MKKVFSSILRVAALASAILLFDMCNKADVVPDIPDNPVPEAPSSDVIHVSVNASVASDGVRSTFANKKITIEAGDELQVAAYQKEGSSYTYYYSGTLTNTASDPGTFSGVLERDYAYGSYSGSDILSDAEATATLLPINAEPGVEFLAGISDENVAQLCTMQATKEAGSAPTFALKPSVSVARFTIDGLGGINGPDAYILVKYIDNNDVEHAVQGIVTVDSGVAIFSVGIASTGIVKSLTLGIHGQTEYADGEPVHVDNVVWYDGIIITSGEKTLPDIINISKTAVRTKFSLVNVYSDFDRGDFGKVFATNGHLFSSVATAKAAGAEPLCMITCLKSMIANPGYIPGTDAAMQNGLAIGLYPMEYNGSDKVLWSDARSYPGRYRSCDSGITVHCEGMPNVTVMQRMAQCCGSKEGKVSSPGNMIPSNSYLYDSTDLAKMIAPAISAATGTNISYSSLDFWVNAQYSRDPVFWYAGGFMATSSSLTMRSFAYYMF